MRVNLAFNFFVTGILINPKICFGAQNEIQKVAKQLARLRGGHNPVHTGNANLYDREVVDYYKPKVADNSTRVFPDIGTYDHYTTNNPAKEPQVKVSYKNPGDKDWRNIQFVMKLLNEGMQ